MKGTNDLHLNEATVIEALQEYLTKRMPTTPLVVKSVKQNGNTYSGPEFVVTVAGGEPVLAVPGGAS